MRRYMVLYEGHPQHEYPREVDRVRYLYSVSTAGLKDAGRISTRAATLYKTTARARRAILNDIKARGPQVHPDLYRIVPVEVKP